ncbi:hypothetical protein OCAR_6214 [Afipia carboxidovorans OM5]|uniref:Transmembrane protein n=1 Tax=Afipia carboxidovorans (strain ATCC 49405 / DSM 1227 / KCTC 32145 / OM5) TaxID=504832 RepID=B6JFA9_AFIC5|nr:hypothetical protein [Afipia carboxidovorans]ACI93328.1 hypothetical protein OCAR_6214 [Afipia carboxidovorans OM5]AEI02954.1 hypothetical protein OCA4_c18170 [Afipia carboxidovorans OM4]AEI06530.1 hypothetical protein OCA5_c18170 [Afipia carboxidovorans OM5]
MPRTDKTTAVSRSEKPEQKNAISTTPRLIWVIVLVSVVVTVVTELRIAGYGDAGLSVIVAYTAFVINIACSALGFQTRERIWWIGNIIVGVLTMSFIGTPTIPSTLWTAGRVLFARFAA